MRRTAASTDATLWVIRTAPTVRPPEMIGTAVASSSVPSEVLYARSLAIAAGQRRGDLRAAGVRARPRWPAPALSDSTRPRSVDDEDAPADVAGGGAREAVQRARASRPQQVARRRGDEVGLPARPARAPRRRRDRAG